MLQGYNSYTWINSLTPGNCETGMASALLTHTQIWTALDRLAARAKLSPSGLAKRSGLDPDHLQQVEAHHARRPRALALDRIGRQGAGRDRRQHRARSCR